jgi:hypothetical protein
MYSTCNLHPRLMMSETRIALKSAATCVMLGIRWACLSRGTRSKDSGCRRSMKMEGGRFSVLVEVV